MLNKILKIISYFLAVLLIALLTFLALEYYRSCERVKLENYYLRIKLMNCQERLQECQRYNLFQQAVSKIAKRKYSKEYNCLNFTRDLQEELRKNNIESSIFINQGRTHAWLGVWIETRTGQFIGLDSGYEVMEVRDK